MLQGNLKFWVRPRVQGRVEDVDFRYRAEDYWYRMGWKVWAFRWG